MFARPADRGLRAGRIGLKESIRKLDSENLQLKEQLGKLRAEKTSQILKPTPEATLVDGDIIALNSGANSVTINRGTRDKVILGMTFAVYSDATAIKPDAIGEYPARQGHHRSHQRRRELLRLPNHLRDQGQSRGPW
jgi:hypothetical protein